MFSPQIYIFFKSKSLTSSLDWREDKKDKVSVLGLTPIHDYKNYG